MIISGAIPKLRKGHKLKQIYLRMVFFFSVYGGIMKTMQEYSIYSIVKPEDTKTLNM